jgi:uncharacterized protein (DUF1778 family)
MTITTPRGDHLDAAESARVTEALLHPPTPSEALRRLMRDGVDWNDHSLADALERARAKDAQ